MQHLPSLSTILTVAVGAKRTKSDMLPPEMMCTEKYSPPSTKLSSAMLIEIVIVGPLENMIGTALARVVPEKSAYVIKMNKIRIY